MTTTAATKPATTITTIGAIKKIATAAAIAGALGLAALGVAGTAAAAPAVNSGSTTHASSEQRPPASWGGAPAPNGGAEGTDKIEVRAPH